jgi:long-chain acyl-CoA synthetase
VNQAPAKIGAQPIFTLDILCLIAARRGNRLPRVKITDDTLAHAFESRAVRYGDRTFLREKIAGRWHDYSWREIADFASRLRAGLLAMGLREGDRVAILAENSPQWVIVDQAVLGLGGVVVPLYTTSGIDETVHVINDSGARVLAVRGAELIAKVLAIAPRLPKLEHLIALHPDASHEPAASIPIHCLASIGTGEGAPSHSGRREDLATFIYTSGTTGPSKGVMLSHGNLLANCEGALNALELDETDTILSILPIAHSFERTAGYYTVMLCGGTIAYAEGLGQIATNLTEIRPTVLLVVPRLLEVVYNRIMRSVRESSLLRRALFRMATAIGERVAWRRHRGLRVGAQWALPLILSRKLVFSRIQEIFGGRLRYLISGGAPLGVEIFKFFAAAEVPLFEGYGLTEASPVVSVNLPGRTRIGSVGRPLFNVEARTAADGELLLRGPSIMRGYFGREDETREALDGDGWLHTGDIARIDRDGFITITDRKKEIIVLSGGKNISPANLEARLEADPLIAQACVIGDRRKHLAAIIVPDFDELKRRLENDALTNRPPEQLVTEASVRALYQRRLREINRTLSDVEAIVDFTLVPHRFSQDNGELTPTLKLRRRVVQQHYERQIEEMYGG